MNECYSLIACRPINNPKELLILIRQIVNQLMLEHIPFNYSIESALSRDVRYYSISDVFVTQTIIDAVKMTGLIIVSFLNKKYAVALSINFESGDVKIVNVKREINDN